MSLVVRRTYEITVASVDVRRMYLDRWLSSKPSLEPFGLPLRPYVVGRFLLDEETVRQFFSLFPKDDRRPRRQLHYEPVAVRRDGDSCTVSFSILATCSDALVS
ncbi:hypothetical protein [Streptomyces sp. NPDC047000]|uniref:hypothetical protein n=1 Tax=Streptomyces sp. NPDC047000 TaxID=3155474 RepID=UPI00340388CB